MADSPKDLAASVNARGRAYIPSLELPPVQRAQIIDEIWAVLESNCTRLSKA